MEPKKFGRYEIKGEIGRGGMATVYHAYDPRFEREVAIKVLPREMLHDPQFRTRFEREAKTIAMLEHPAIVPVYDFGEEDGQPYFVMRYMIGGSLSDRMKKGPMTIQDVAHLFGRLAPALDEAHAKGIIHRDLKPGNILFDQHDDPYISDFGIAKIAASQANFTGSAILGTPAYMSPEQAQGEGIDGRSDIYGLAVILFELLTGTQPYHGDTPMSVVVKHITDPIPHILDVNPDLPASIEAVIEKAMAKDREERFSTVKALTEALDAVVRGETPDIGIIEKTLVASSRTVTSKSPVSAPRTLMEKKGQASGPEPAASRKKSGLWIGLGGVALLVSVAAVAGVVLFKDRIPFLAAPPTTTQHPIVRSTDTLEARQPTNTDPPAVVLTPDASDTLSPTPTFAPSPTPTLTSLPHLGGADLIAFLNNKDIWVMGVDGSNPSQITKNGGAKTDLQWSPDGQSVFYINGTCAYSVSVPEKIVAEIACFTGAKYLEAFEISPDGLRVAISMDRDLYVVPFDLTAIYNARSGKQLASMKGCLPITGLDHDPFMSVQWSNDGTKLAVKIISSEPGVKEAIRILDISKCESYLPHVQDNFPVHRFTMTDYARFREIPFFDWDGDAVFVLNSRFRYGMGFLFKYYTLLYKGEELKPLEDTCCYAAAHFSPDGSYLLFAYQFRLSPNDQPQLYYIPFGSIGTDTSYTPLPLPDGAFNPPSDPLDVALRPVKP